MTLLAIDIGTTHCKAGLFTPGGTALNIASKPMVTHRAPAGWSYFDPEETMQIVATVVRDVTQESQTPIAAIGIASMAETGILVDRQSGEARSFFLPWFETNAQPQADKILEKSDPLDIYRRFGLKASFKSSLARLMWFRQAEPGITDQALWLSAADYVLYRLTFGRVGA